jgi:hypothetical protein
VITVSGGSGFDLSAVFQHVVGRTVATGPTPDTTPCCYRSWGRGFIHRQSPGQTQVLRKARNTPGPGLPNLIATLFDARRRATKGRGMLNKKALTTWYIAFDQAAGRNWRSSGRLVGCQIKNPMRRCTSHHTYTHKTVSSSPIWNIRVSACCA